MHAAMVMSASNCRASSTLKGGGGPAEEGSLVDADLAGAEGAGAAGLPRSATESVSNGRCAALVGAIGKDTMPRSAMPCEAGCRWRNKQGDQLGQPMHQFAGGE